MSINLTEAALRRMHDFLARDPAAIGVRFGIKRTGCSGYAYTVDIAQSVADNDSVFDQDGIRVLVDPKAMPFINGTEIDFRRKGLSSMFVFSNPNATGECGCGESFTIDKSV